MAAGRGKGRCWARAARVTGGAAGLVFALAVPARAAEGESSARPVRVHYRPAPGLGDCVSHQSVAAAVERALKRPVFSAAADSDVVVALGVQAPSSATVELLDRDGHSLGTRRLAAKDCAELTETVAFTMTLMVDFRADEVADKRARAASESHADGSGEVAAASTEPAAVEPPAPTPAAAPGSSAAPAVAPQGPASARPSEAGAEGWQLGAGVAADTGLTPLPLFGLQGELGLSPNQSWRFALRGRGERALQAGRALGELGAWRAAASIEGCRMRAGSGVGFGVCGGLTPGLVWVLVSGYAADRTTALFGADAEVTLRMTVPLDTGLSLALQLGGAVPLLRNDWHASSSAGDVPLFRAAAVRAVGLLGLLWGRAGDLQ